MRMLLFALALFSVAARTEDGAPAAPLLAATLTGVDGQPVAMAKLLGKPLVVNFWARWCGPCREEIPELAKRAATAKNVVVVGIALEDQPAPVADFAKAYGMNYRILLAGDKGIALLRALGNAQAGLPFTVVLDGQGRVVYRKLGRMQAADMDAAFAAAGGRGTR